MPLFGPPNIEKLRAKGNVKGLIKALAYQKSDDVRWRAAEALGDMGDETAVEPLIAALRDPDSALRRAAVQSLGKLGQAECAVESQTALFRTRDPDVRQAAVSTVAQLGLPAVDPLIALFEDSNATVSQAAATALAQIGGPAIDPLIAACKSKTGRVAVQAREALIQIGEHAVDALIGALENRETSVAQVLGQMGDRRAVEPLIAALEDKKLRSAAIRALVQIGDNRAVKPLVELLEQSSWFDQNSVSAALAKMGWEPDHSPAGAWYCIHRKEWSKCVDLGEHAIEPLVATMNGQAKLAKAAARTLGQIGGAQATKALVTALQNGGQSLRLAAADALDKQGWQPADEKDAAIYWTARDMWDRCVEIGEPAVDTLIAVLNEKSTARRQSAAETLGKIASERAVPALLALLKGKKKEVVLSAAAALGEIGDRRAVAPLLGLLKSPVTAKKVAAISALGQIGDPTAVNPLTSSLARTQESEPVRQAAAQALLDLCHAGTPSQEQRISSLMAILDRADKPLRRAAAREIVTLYHSGKLGDEQKQAVLKQRESIEHHTDQHQHSDFENEKGCFHRDESTHTDTGAGIEFVL